MNLPARAAAVRGDEYQYTYAWWVACEAMNNGDVVSVSVEDPSGGSFDDVVTRRRTRPDSYEQVKSSNHGDVAVDDAWLTKQTTTKGKTPLQHFFATWQRLDAGGSAFELSLVTNRGFDTKHPLLGTRDLQTDVVDVDAVQTAGPRSALGKAREQWCAHLTTEVPTLTRFLAAVRWRQVGSESEWRRHIATQMRLAGLRHDDDAISLGVGIVRSWVTSGTGPQTLDDIRRSVSEHDLLARTGVLNFALWAIDRPASAINPNVVLDVTECFPGPNPFERIRMREPGDWAGVIEPALATATSALESYRTRRVHVFGAARLPVYFAAGKALPDVRGWVLSLDQQGVEWTTSAVPEMTAMPRLMKRVPLGGGTDIAVALALTTDITKAVERHAGSELHDVGELVVLGPEDAPSRSAVPSNEWLLGWLENARTLIREEGWERGARRVHLYAACPAAGALFLGHLWNVLPPVTIYEFDKNVNSYFASITY